MLVTWSDYDSVPYFLRKDRRWILAVFWVCGLICGIFLSQYAGTSIVPLMRRMIAAPVSIVDLLSNSFIPFLFTVYAVCFSVPWLLFSVCFWEAFLYAFSCVGISQAFGSAGWLMSALFLVINSVHAALLYLIWVRAVSGEDHMGVINVATSSVILALICTIQYYIISPFTACLINN